jgi:hypothetical protein
MPFLCMKRTYSDANLNFSEKIIAFMVLVRIAYIYIYIYIYI